MKHRLISFTLLLALLFCLPGCESRREKPLEPSNKETSPAIPAVATKSPFREAIVPARYELPSGSLATWRDFAPHKPVLILFSSQPLLAPLHEENREEIRQLLRSGTKEEIVRRGRHWSADPALLPAQTVSAAIEAGLFSEIVFVPPTSKPPAEFSPDKFREQAQAAGILTPREAKDLTLKDEGVISGEIRGIPLRIVHPERLPKLATPAIIHIDLGYFKELYINEVKTPSYELIYQLASQIKEADCPTLAATLSFSNQEDGFSLESRFLIRDLADTLSNPQFLGGNTPASWALRASALYANSMFSEGKARELIQQAVTATPTDAAAHYALALDLFEQKLNDQGFAALDQAVKLDGGYGLEYLYLADRGLELGQRAKAIELLRKAVAAMPDLPLLNLQLANHLIQAGRGAEAIPLITELRALKWSGTIHPGVTSLLEEMQQVATANKLPRLPDGPPAQTGSPAGSPPGRMPGFNHNMMGTPKQ